MLGSVVVEAEGQAIDLGGAVQRRLLAALATSSQPVPDDRLGELIWGDSPTADLAGALRVAVSRLRTALGPAREYVVRTEHGYQLAVPAASLDHHRFSRLVADAAAALAAGDSVAAGRAYEAGLALWRGRPWLELGDAPDLDGVRARLEELRAAAVEELAGTRLATGELGSAIAELRELIAEAPLRERRWELLALALYRSGRQADALEELRTVRALLDRELGVDLGPVLADLQRRMLNQDPTLEPVRRPPRTLPPVRNSAFVGRIDELDLLTELLDTGGCALVTGDAGLGKTALLGELSAYAIERGYEVLSASAQEGAPPYWLWQQAVGREQDLLGETAASERFVRFERFADQLAGRGRTLVLLDDLQWADASSGALLAHLAKREQPSPVVIVAATRPVAAALDELRTVLARQGRTVDLAGLEAQQVGQLLKELTGRTVEPAEIETVAARTGGNPLFVKAISRQGKDESVPEVIRDALRQELYNLPAECVALLSIASAAGRTVHPAVVSAVSRVPVEQLLMTLQPALSASVLLPRGSWFEFRHDLLADVLEADLPVVERAAIHLRVAEHLEATAPRQLSDIARHRLDAVPLGDPAVARASAAAAGQQALEDLAYEDAAELYDGAAAIAGAAPAELSGLLLGAGRAWFLSGRHDVAVERCMDGAEVARRAGDLEGVANAAMALPESPNFEWLTLVRTWCGQALHGLPAADSPLRAQLLAQQALTYLGAHDPAEMIAASGEALVMAERLDDNDALKVALRASQLAWSVPDGHRRRLEFGRRMVQVGDRTGDLTSVAWGRLWQFDALVQSGEVDQAEAEQRALQPVLDRLGDRGLRWNAARGRAAVAIARGRFDEARGYVEDVKASLPEGVNENPGRWLQFPLQLSILTGDDFEPPVLEPGLFPQPLIAMSICTHLSRWHLAHGRTSAAERLYRELPEISDREVPTFVRLLFEAVRGGVAAELGDEAGAARAYRRLTPYGDLQVTTGAGLAVVLGSTQYYLGLTAAATGNPAAADHFRQAIAANDHAGFAPFAAHSRYRLARLLADRHPAAAHALATEARHTADRLGLHPLLTATGELLSQTSDPDN